jgi:hypothetical protein
VKRCIINYLTANEKALLSVKEFEKQKFELMPNIEPKFEEILAAKREYYGWTEAAIQFAAEEYARQLLLQQCSVSGSLLKSLHQDLVGFQQMGFLTPDAKSGLGIAIEQVERYMRSELEARQQ